jgi:hypothetical protein
MTEQLDLFGLPVSIPDVVLREERRFGQLDAKTGLAIRNHYSNRISGARLAAYEQAFREQRALS